MSEMKFIYKKSYFESKRHIKSEQDWFYLNAEDTHDVFDLCPICHHYRVELVRVSTDSIEYEIAVRNTERVVERKLNAIFK